MAPLRTNKNKNKTTDKEKKKAFIDDKEAVRLGRKVTWIGFWVNAFLGVAKVVGGIFSRSGALVADGIHSFSDFLSDIIVLVMVGISRRPANRYYQFGHGRFEALATVLLSVVLVVVAIGIFYEGVVKIIRSLHGEELPQPTYVALIIIVLSIVLKEWLFHYTKRVGEEIKSEAVVANAWHHRSDSFSSLATLVGVGGAMFLGDKWRILDPIAAMVVGVFIIIVGFDMAKPALREMLGFSLSREQKRAILNALKETPGVMGWTHLQTFKSGYDGFVIVHIKVEPEISVKEAHLIASRAERNMRNAVTDLSVHASTHIEPYTEPVKKNKNIVKKLSKSRN